MLSVLGSYLTNKIFTKVLGDGTVSKEPTTQGQGTESHLIVHMKKPSTVALIHNTRDRQIPRAHWSGGLAEWMSCRFSERNCFQDKVESYWEDSRQLLASTCRGTHVPVDHNAHVQTCTHPQEYVYMPLHTHKVLSVVHTRDLWTPCPWLQWLH